MSKPEPLFSITLDKDNVKKFLAPLKDIQKIKVNQAVFKFNEEKKTISMSVINDTNTIMSIVKYKPLEAEIEKDFEFAIHDLNEFINCIYVFDEGAQIDFHEKYCDISYEDSNIKYIGSETSVIKQGKEKLSAKVNWFTSFVFDPSEFTSFIKAINVINGKHIIFTGEKGKKSVGVQVRDKAMANSNSFNVKIEVDEIFETFKTVIDKEYFMSIISGSSSTYEIQIGNLLVLFKASTPVHTIDHCVAPVV